jgi:lysophospholipase L1-like esterase
MTAGPRVYPRRRPEAVKLDWRFDMTLLSGRLPVLILGVLGTVGGLALLEAGARVNAVLGERREGRFDRDLGRLKAPAAGARVSLGQIIQRSENPRIVYELRPRLDVVFADARLTTSDAGRRGPEIARPKPAGTFRIAGLGDSYMFGQGVADDEIYLARLRRQLADQSPGHVFDTVNLAVPGYNTAMEVESFKDQVESLQPDLVLIEIVGNDLDLPNFLWSSVDPWSLERSFFWDFVRLRLGRTERSEVTGLSEAPLEGGGLSRTYSRDETRIPARYADLVGLGAFKDSIAQLGEIGRRRQIPVVAITHGVWFEKEMLETLEAAGIPMLGLRAALRRKAKALGAPDYARSPLALSPTDLHPSALGHQVIAEELATWLEPWLRLHPI